MSEFDIFLKKAGDFHGHICAGIALGTRISLAAMRELGLTAGVKTKSLIVYTEIDRCMTDAVQMVTGCSLGRRSLKHMDYGKFAATFVNLDTGRAVRGTVKETFSNEDTIEETLKKLAGMPDSELVTLQEVTVDIPETDRPGLPVTKAECATCGERIMDGREVKKGGKTLCRACAGASYYREVKK
ncbi:MAG: FmdE family protein [Dehalococcoidales bacterium]